MAPPPSGFISLWNVRRIDPVFLWVPTVSVLCEIYSALFFFFLVFFLIRGLALLAKDFSFFPDDPVCDENTDGGTVFS